MRLVVFDYETAGLMPWADNIQLAAIAVDEELTEIETFERKIAFNDKHADQTALKMNHYDADIWAKEALPEAQVTTEFNDFLKKYADIKAISRKGDPYFVAKLCGYNCQLFDLPRLKKMFEKHQKFLPAHFQTMDVLVRVYWWFYEKKLPPLPSYKLSDVATYFEIPTDGAHEALSDCRMTLKILKHMMAYG